MPAECPVCGADSDLVYRCTECGADLVDRDRQTTGGQA